MGEMNMPRHLLACHGNPPVSAAAISGLPENRQTA